jgi:lipopolysaccharide export system protein LptA
MAAKRKHTGRLTMQNNCNPLGLILSLSLSLCLVFVLGAVPGWAQDGSGKDSKQEKISHDSSRPVDITSDSLEVDDERGVFVFRGEVVARQDNATIYSDQLNVYYTRKKADADETENGRKTQSRSIEKIVARGSVRIVQEERVATGERAEYEYTRGSVVLTGSPRVVQGDNTIAGEKITVYLDDERSIVEGGTRERVQATFTPDDDGDK